MEHNAESMFTILLCPVVANLMQVMIDDYITSKCQNMLTSSVHKVLHIVSNTPLLKLVEVKLSFEIRECLQCWTQDQDVMSV